MSLTSTQIDEIFAAMGLPAPSSAVATSLEAIPNTYDALNTIIDLPEVQSEVIPILAMFDLSLGHDPTSATLASMVENNGGNIASIANQFVESQTFANLYNAGTLLSASTIVDASNSGIITALFVNGLGHPPTTATLEGFFGLTLGQAFLEFTQSNAIAETPTIDASLTNIMELAAGIPAQAVPPPVQSFTLTNGSDTVISGENTVGTTTPGTLVLTPTVAVPQDIAINAPLGGPFGNQPTLTSGDVINLTTADGSTNTLNATFDGSDLLTTLTIKGVQDWNITQTGPGPSIILLEGTPGSIDGVTSLSYNGNGFFGSELLVGAPGTNGIDPTTSANGFNLSLSNVPGGGVDVFFAPGAFSPGGGDAINVTATAVGNTLGGTSMSFGNSTDIEAGSAGATGGFATWNVTSNGANAVNDIALSTNGSNTPPTTLKVSDDGSSTIIWAGASASEWAQLSVVDASGTTGTLTITGAENGSHGLLSQDTADLTEVVGGSGADTFDLSAFGGSTGGSVAGLSIFGGANTTIELSNTEINFVSAPGADAFATWSSVAVLDDVGVGNGNDVGGAVNMAQFPGTETVTLLNHNSGVTGINQTADFVVTNATNGLVFNFNQTDQHGNDFSITGVAGTTDVTLNYGAGDNHSNNMGSTGTLTSLNIDDLTINVNGNNAATQAFYAGGIVSIANSGDHNVLTLDTDIPLAVGNVGGSEALSHDTLTLLGGTELISPTPPFTVTWSETGTLDLTGSGAVELPVTNASTIDNTGTGILLMSGPDDDVNYGLSGVTVTSDAGGLGSILQGSLGVGPGELLTGDDTLTDLQGGTSFLGDGAADTINLGQDNPLDGINDVYFGEYALHGPVGEVLPIETVGLASAGFWGNANSAGPMSILALSGGAGNGYTSDATGTAGTSFDLTTINGFTLGTTHDDNLFFDHSAWIGIGSGATGTDHLVNGDLATVGAGTATGVIASTTGQALGTANLVIYNTLGNVANAAALAADLSSTLGDVTFGTATDAGHEYHMLFAYSTGTAIQIADVDFIGNGSAATAGAFIVASDMVSLVGQNNLLTFAAHVHDVHFS